MDTIGIDMCERVPIDETVGSSSTIQVDNGEYVDCQSPNKAAKKLNALYVGMLFDSIEEAKRYYAEYGHQEGFSIRIRTTSRARRGSDEVTGVTYVCTHQGKYNSKAKEEAVTVETESGEKISRRSFSTIKCGCEASMRIVKDDKWTSKWKVSIFNDDHNHKVITSARKMKLRSNHCFSKVAKDLNETLQRENIQIGRVSTILGGDPIGFDDMDCYSHLRNVKHKKLEGGDVQSMLNYFRKKQIENPQFFYAIQCDDEGKATNFFWVDARSRLTYEYFGDVVTFDTTYRIKKYDMPFVPFTGINHHYQPVQFGCALLLDETEATFLWLFQIWLQAMGGRHPISFIINQDLAMNNAIAKVFPNTRHRLCIWHIKKKFAEKLSYKYFENFGFRGKIEKCIWSTYTGEEFEKQWKSVILENGLEGNDWLQQLFQLRESWVPVYNRTTFFAGMNTTWRSESINAFFNGFVTSTTNLKEFVINYEQALKKLVKNERSEDFESEHKNRCVNDNELILKHAATVYTRNMFEKFKEEWVQVPRFKVEEREINDGYHTYLVKTKFGEPEEFLLKFNLDSYEGTCECRKFEFVGILCRHFLKVFFRLDIDDIPPHFILKRWRQGANKFRLMDSQMTSDEKEPLETLRFGNMCQQATKLACFASPSMKAYTIFMNSLNELSKQICEIRFEEMAVPESSDGKCSNNVSRLLLLDLNILQTKGRRKDEKGKEKIYTTGRLRSSIELSQQKKKRKCGLCQKLGHDKRICPTNSNRKRIESIIQDNDDIQELGQDMESDHKTFPSH